jgi:hypothetical protein
MAQSDAEIAADLIDLLDDEEHVLTGADRALLRIVLKRLSRQQCGSADAGAERERCAAIVRDMATGPSRTPVERAVAGKILERIEGGK